MSTDLQVIEESTELSVDSVLGRLDKIQELMRRAMIPGVDYGVIPGTKGKPTLLKPGAEKLAVMFKFSPAYNTTKTFSPDGHLTVESTCKILDANEHFLGEASAICSTRESKYAYRNASRKCPICGKEAIIKGKEEYGGGFVCFKKKDGCGAKFADNDHQITQQEIGRVANPDVADSYNTVIRIAEKRSFLAAIRLVTGASALFDEEQAHVERDPEEVENPVLARWREQLAEAIEPAHFEEAVRQAGEAHYDKHLKAALWGMILASAESKGLYWDKQNKRFVA